MRLVARINGLTVFDLDFMELLALNGLRPPSSATYSFSASNKDMLITEDVSVIESNESEEEDIG